MQNNTEQTNQLIITIPENKKQKELAIEQFRVAELFVVNSNDSFNLAADTLKTIKEKAKELDATRKDITKPIDESKKRIMDLFREPLEYLSKAERCLKQSMLSYQQKLEKIRRIEEAKRQEAARKEQERLRKLAEKAAAKGKTEKAAEIEERAEMVQTPVVKMDIPKVSGISTRKTWYAEVTDSKALLRGILDGTVPSSVATINMQVLNKMAIALKKEMNYPGVVAKFKEDIAARS